MALLTEKKMAPMWVGHQKYVSSHSDGMPGLHSFPKKLSLARDVERLENRRPEDDTEMLITSKTTNKIPARQFGIEM